MALKAANELAKPKNKRRTPPHNKHVVWPGMRTPTNVTITSGSIKGKSTNKNPPTAAGKSISYSDPLWTAYDVAAKKIGQYGSASPLQARRMAEDEYVLRYLGLVKHKKAMKIKRKYTTR